MEKKQKKKIKMSEAIEKFNSLSRSHANILILQQALVDSMHNHSKQLKDIETYLKKNDKKRSQPDSSKSTPKKQKLKLSNEKSNERSTPSPKKKDKITTKERTDKLKDTKDTKVVARSKTIKMSSSKTTDDQYSNAEVATQPQNKSNSLSDFLISKEFDLNSNPDEFDISKKLRQKNDIIKKINEITSDDSDNDNANEDDNDNDNEDDNDNDNANDNDNDNEDDDINDKEKDDDDSTDDGDFIN